MEVRRKSASERRKMNALQRASFRLFTAAALVAAVSVLGGCQQFKDFVATCHIVDVGITCGVDKPQIQDLSASKEAEDEKPDRTFTKSSLRLEKAPS
jgi:hypothetical protein